MLKLYSFEALFLELFQLLDFFLITEKFFVVVQTHGSYKKFKMLLFVEQQSQSVQDNTTPIWELQVACEQIPWCLGLMVGSYLTMR